MKGLLSIIQGWVAIRDAVSGVAAKVNSSGELETTATVGTINIGEQLLAQDLFADMYFKILTFGAATDVIRFQVPDLSIDVSITLTGATDLLTARDVVIAGLNADATFKDNLEAVIIKDNPFIHVSSLLLSEAGEHLDGSDVIVSVTSGTSTVDVPVDNDILKSRQKISSGQRNPADRRKTAVAISGDVNINPGGIGKRYFELFKYSGSSDMQVDGTTPKIFTIPLSSTDDIFISQVRLFGGGNGIAFNKFLSKSGAGGVPNGIQVEIKTDDQILTLLPIKTTEDFKNIFASSAGEFRIDIQAGADQLLAVLAPALSFPLRKVGSFETDDYIKITINDDLTSGLTQLEALAAGFRV